MPSLAYGLPIAEHGFVSEQSIFPIDSLLSEVEANLEALILSASDYDTLHEHSSRRIRTELTSTQQPIPDIFSNPAVIQLPLATALLRAQKLSEYGIIVLHVKPAYGDILYGSDGNSDNGKSWVRETQKESLAFLVPGNHPEFPKGRTWRSIKRLVLHPDLITFAQPLVGNKGKEGRIEKAHYVELEHHTPSFTTTEVSFHLARANKDEALTCHGHGIWSVDSIDFPLIFRNLTLETMVSDKLRDTQLVLVFVTTREWKVEQSLFDVVERIFAEEGLRAVWIERGDSPLLERNIEMEGSSC